MHPIVPYAHAAYCTGYAASGAEVTDRTRWRRDAAIAYAVKNCDRPDVIEATLHLGQLDGVWANIFQRRASLYDSALADFSKIWKDLYDPSREAELIHAVRAQAGLVESDRPSDTAITYATGLILFMLQGLISKSQWNQLRMAVADALMSGYAMGEADSLEILADQIGRTGFNFDKAFQIAKSKFENIPGMVQQVDQYLNDLLQTVAANTARKLAKMAADGDSPEEMQQYLDDQLHGGNSQVFIGILDALIHGAITLGILWFLRNAGAAQVWFITAGDERVCPVCDEVEGQNPYSIFDAPECPQHTNCRCTLYTENALSPLLLTGLVD